MDENNSQNKNRSDYLFYINNQKRLARRRSALKIMEAKLKSIKHPTYSQEYSVSKHKIMQERDELLQLIEDNPTADDAQINKLASHLYDPSLPNTTISSNVDTTIDKKNDFDATFASIVMILVQFGIILAISMVLVHAC